MPRNTEGLHDRQRATQKSDWHFVSNAELLWQASVSIKLSTLMFGWLVVCFAVRLLLESSVYESLYTIWRFCGCFSAFCQLPDGKKVVVCNRWLRYLLKLEKYFNLLWKVMVILFSNNKVSVFTTASHAFTQTLEKSWNAKPKYMIVVITQRCPSSALTAEWSIWQKFRKRVSNPPPPSTPATIHGVLNDTEWIASFYSEFTIVCLFSVFHNLSRYLHCTVVVCMRHFAFLNMCGLFI